MPAFPQRLFPSSFYSRMLWCILLVSLALKIPHLSAYYYNPDEAWQVFVARQPDWLSAMRYNFADITHPPFTVQLLHFLLQWNDAVWVPRLAATIAGLLLSLAGYHLGKAATGNRVIGLLLAMTFAFSLPFAILSVAVRAYIYMLMFMVAGLAFYFRYVRKQRGKDLALYALFMALALFSGYSACPVVLVCGLVHGVVLWRRHGVIHRTAMTWWLAHAALGGWLLLLYFQHPFATGEVTLLSDYHYFPNRLLRIMGAILVYPLIGFGLIEFICALCAITAWKKLRADPFFLTYMLLPFIALLAISGAADALEFYPFDLSRHSIFMAPFALLIIYSGLVASLKEKNPEPRWLAVVMLCLQAGSSFTMSEASQYNEISFAAAERAPMKDAIDSLPRNSVILIDNQTHYMLLGADMVDAAVYDDRYATLRIGDKSLVALNQPALRVRRKDGSIHGDFFLRPADLAAMTRELARNRKTLYLIQMGFSHGFLTEICDKEAPAAFTTIHATQRAQLYAFSPADGLRMARECIARLEQEKTAP